MNLHRFILQYLTKIVVVSSFSLFMLSTPAHSAFILEVNDEFCTHAIEGRIKQGDLAKIQNSFQGYEIFPEKSGGWDTPRPSYCLNSPGGNYIEGLVIAKFFMQQGIRTIVKSNSICYSACAIIFMSGSIRTEDTHGPDRYLERGGELGFHAPYLELDRDYISSIEAEAYFDIANRLIGYFLQLMSTTSDFSNVPWFRNSLVTQLSAKGRDEFLMVETIEQIIMWDIDSPNLYVDPFNYRNLVQACVNFQNWLDDKRSEQIVDLNLYLESREPDSNGLYFVNTGGEWRKGCYLRPTSDYGEGYYFCSIDEAKERYIGQCPDELVFIRSAYGAAPNAKF